MVKQCKISYSNINGLDVMGAWLYVPYLWTDISPMKSGHPPTIKQLRLDPSFQQDASDMYQPAFWTIDTTTKT